VEQVQPETAGLESEAATFWCWWWWTLLLLFGAQKQKERKAQERVEIKSNVLT